MIPCCTYKTYLKLDYKYRYFIDSRNGFIYQGGTYEELITIKHIIKISISKLDSVGCFNSIENYLDIE